MNTLLLAAAHSSSSAPLGIIIPIAAVVVLIFAVILLIKMTWKVAEPDEALIISGFGAGGEGDQSQGPTGFKIAVGKGTIVLPALQTARTLSLAAHKADLVVDCVTSQGIPVHIRGVVVYKVGDSYAEIANAARRFLDADDKMSDNVNEVFAGHLRSIVGSLTVEEIINAREKLAQQTRESSATEMQRLGLEIDSLQIQEVGDPTKYIENLAKPHQAKVEAEARIAEAERNREATEREQAAAALAAKAVSDSEIQQAKVAALANTEKAKAAQAGPLADAQARQEVVVQETKIAQLEAQRKEMELQATVVKPAEAEKAKTIAEAEAAKEKVVLDGEAQALATKAKGLAEAEATKAKGLAEGEAIKARAEALKENQEAVIGTQLVEKLPEVARAMAESMNGVEHLTILNGAEGMGQFMQGLLGTGVSVIPLLQDALSKGKDKVTVAPAARRAVAPAAVEETAGEHVEN